MKQTLFRGSGVALVTPMRPDYSIDYDVLGGLVETQITKGTDALVVAGTTGEGSTLTDQEHEELIRFCARRAKGQVPVIAGAGSNNTAHAVSLCRAAERAGADALLLVTPYYNKATQEGLYLHFKACMDATKLPIILYNVPSRTGVTLQPETCRRLSQLDRIVALKEAGGSISQFAKIAALCGDDLVLYSGNDDQIVPTMSLGGKGVVSVLANLAPEDTHRICEAYLDGHIGQSRALQLSYLDLIQALFLEVSPIPVKEALNQLGIPVGPCRLPLCGMGDQAKAALTAALANHHFL